jgi:hypothetical protein
VILENCSSFFSFQILKGKLADPVKIVRGVQIGQFQFIVISDFHGCGGQSGIREVNIALYSAFFVDSAEHDNLGDFFIPDHSPEVVERELGWALRCDEIWAFARVGVLWLWVGVRLCSWRSCSFLGLWGRICCR